MNKRIVVRKDVCDAGCGGDDSLPVAEELLLGHNAIAGYFVRSWGAGFRFEQNRIEHGCPMVLWALPHIGVLHWIARVEQIHSQGGFPRGTLRLVANPSQPGATGCGLTATSRTTHVNLNDLGLPDAHGGWTVGGELGLNVPVEGLLGVRIQAVAQNCRVLWSAISQAHPE